MPLTIKIGTPPREIQATIELKMRKTLDGNILIADHPKMDIMIVPSSAAVVAIPKPHAGDNVYEHQRELMQSLFEGGAVIYDSVQSSANFGVLEAAFAAEPADSDVDPIQVVLYEIERFIKRTSNDDLRAETYDKNIEDRFTDPSDEDSTELGEVKPEEDEPYRKSLGGSNSYAYAGYGYLY
tara:strand:+ start:5345 stop:5890 length:546 start_codon:yes stop_codon:yes gene_type:complete